MVHQVGNRKRGNPDFRQEFKLNQFQPKQDPGIPQGKEYHKKHHIEILKRREAKFVNQSILD